MHGYIEEKIVPQIKGDISIGNQLSLTQLESINNSTGQCDLANGVSYVYGGGWTTGAFVIDAHDGKFELTLEALICTEMPT